MSQVCVEDDSSCERIREKLEQFEPQNDMVAFVQGWGTGDSIPDPPRFINYSAGERPSTGPTYHVANFSRISTKPMMPSAPTSQYEPQAPAAPAEQAPQHERSNSMAATGLAAGGAAAIGASAFSQANHHQEQMNQAHVPDMQSLSLSDAPQPIAKSPEPETKPPFGGVALPGMASAAPSKPPMSDRQSSSMAPPPVPGSMAMPEPRAPSRQSMVSARDINDTEDPMARALANLRREPPPTDSVRRNPSHRRADSVYSNKGRRAESIYSNAGSVKPTASPGPGGPPAPYRTASPAPAAQPQPYQSARAPSPAPGQVMSGRSASPAPGSQQPQQPQSAGQHQPYGGAMRQSVDLGLSPPPGGHTAAALARSMDDFHRQANNRQSVNYSNFADDIVGGHPSRPSSAMSNRPSGVNSVARAPSPAMMQPPSQPTTHIADEVLSQYHQAFPGERSRSRANSRAGSINSRRSSFNPASQSAAQAPPSPAREGFAGIGARGRSPSPQPGPPPSNQVQNGSLGPQNIGISLDESGGVSHDSMAEAYRRQYQQQQAQQTHQPQQGGRPTSQIDAQSAYAPQGYGGFSQQAQAHQAQQTQGQKSSGQPLSPVGSAGYGGYGQQQQQQPQVQASTPTAAQQYARGQQTQQAPPQQQPPQQQQQQHFPAYSPIQQPQQVQQPVQHAPIQQAAPQPVVQQRIVQPVQQPAQQYQAPQAQQQYGGYSHPAQQQQPQQPQHQPPQAQQYGYQPPQQQVQQPHQQQYGVQSNQYARSVSPAPPVQQQQQPPQQQYAQHPQHAQQQQQQYGYRAPSPQPQYAQQAAPRARSPSPQPGVPPTNAAPTGQWSTTGQPVLFCE